MRLFVFVLRRYGSALLCLFALTHDVWAAEPELIAPRPGQDLSAYRYDCDVFGWNREGTEVGAVGIEVTRGPRGRHRGTAFLLVYKVGQTVPIHNVNTHVITHADFPDNPVPLDTAEDLMWTIENAYQEMWPKRPTRHRPAQWMHVEPIWDPTPASQAKAAVVDPKNMQAPALPRPDEACTPAVGFILNYRGQKRIMPHQVLDMQARCRLLQQTNVRTYWLNDKVAASMVRFDFSPKPDNEQSARFVVSAVWHLAKALQFDVHSTAPLALATKNRIQKVVKTYGTFTKHGFVADTHKTDKAALQQLQMITAPVAFVPLARRVGKALGQPDILVQITSHTQDTLTLHYAQAPVVRQVPAVSVPAEQVSPVPKVHVFGTDIPRPLQDISPPAQSLQTPAQSSAAPSVPPKVQTPAGEDYLRDWKVP